MFDKLRQVKKETGEILKVNVLRYVEACRQVIAPYMVSHETADFLNELNSSGAEIHRRKMFGCDFGRVDGERWNVCRSQGMGESPIAAADVENVSGCPFAR
jgi:hypothetical protein